MFAFSFKGIRYVMPIYEYQCQSCHAVFEEWQSGFQDQEVPCPECGGESQKLISHSSFHLKGGGWYADGYGAKNAGSNPGDAQKPSAESGAKAPDKTESAPASTCPAKSDSSSAGSAS
jgi:putative FmdB family regulatory protein